MIQIPLKYIRSILNSSFNHANKITCYHCGESSSPKRTIYIDFDRNIRPVCCNGCAAILKTVKNLEMYDEYHAQKSLMRQSNEPK